MSRTAILSFSFCIAVGAGCAVPGRSPSRIATAAPAFVEREDRALRAQIEALTKGYRGDVGIYVRHLGTGATVAIAADDTFPTASMVKVPLLIALFDQQRLGRLHLDSLYALTDSTLLQPDGDDIIAKVKLGSKFELRKLAFMMMAFSDNTASVWIQSMIGGSNVANAWLEANGYRVTRDNSKLPERRTIWQRWGWGMTSPREMAGLVTAIRQGRVISPEASERMYDLMTNSYWRDEALSSIPPHVQSASKQGAVNRSRSEVVLVNSPGGDYVLCIITKNNEDERWVTDNEGYVLIRKVSWAVYHHFNQADPWRPLWSR
jgi:beta-lactamase class A